MKDVAKNRADRKKKLVWVQSPCRSKLFFQAGLQKKNKNFKHTDWVAKHGPEQHLIFLNNAAKKKIISEKKCLCAESVPEVF